ncbi:MarR family winged helix-turn-helix transcriptional regulator [Rhodalgimonas zhirmunskyi]|uniref:MarR family transcriptional regulator n=1 Tax=Rhodalgimonas zhirmunskyi TaxID=2964767 RepID=A0AAJ1UBL6_9RHOB|nr:MarR family transcriptional regulator [Rhodoalgimonas zhirmunskyi]MDQ2093581.1 MarR family transcriptional regulator [Rhodoalgimonas zhirmunskyi]
MYNKSLREQVGYQVARINHILNVDLGARLKPMGISVDQCRILSCLTEAGRLPMGELAARVFVEPANLTKIIDKMTSESLVMRVPDDKDRRRVLVALATAGIAKNTAIESILEEHEEFARKTLTSQYGHLALI